MRYFILGMALMLIIGLATAEPVTGTATISISTPTKREDGSALPANQIKEYTLLWGVKSGVYTGSATIATTDFPYKWKVPVDVPIGGSTLIYFAATVTDTDGKTSKPSAEMTKPFYSDSASVPAAVEITAVSGWACTADKPGYTCRMTK